MTPEERLDCERRVLAHMIESDGPSALVCELGVAAREFSTPAHRAIAFVALACWEYGLAATVPRLLRCLWAAGLYGEAGGRAYLERLWLYEPSGPVRWCVGRMREAAQS